MAKSKPLTIPNLISAMKEAGFATKSDVKGIVANEIDSRSLATKTDVEEIVANEINSRGLATKNDVQSTIRSEILASERRLKLRIGQVRNDLAARIAKVAVNSHAEYAKLKQKVESAYA